MTDIEITITIKNADAFDPMESVKESLWDNIEEMFIDEAVAPIEIEISMNGEKRTIRGVDE